MNDVRIPKVGMSTIEVEVLQVLVSVGQRVTVGQVLMTIAADKVDLEIEANLDGVISELLVGQGEMREVGDIVARITPD